MIFDIATRWNNQYDMLKRFMKLRRAIIFWIRHNDQYQTFFFIKEKWRQINYLIQFLISVKSVINWLSKSKKITVHQIWTFYDSLFDHLKVQKNKADSVHSSLWNANLKQTIEAERKKLIKYYNKTEQFFEKYLNFVTILNFDTKLKFYRISN